MLLMIDNYDSFTYNLVQYFAELGAEVAVYRNDEITLQQIEALQPQHIVVSPGPCTPNEAGISVAAIKHFGGKIPVLGVCLGHQAIGEVFGAPLINLPQVMHGVARKTIVTQKDFLFNDMPATFLCGRYHSWVVDVTKNSDVEVIAQDEDGYAMALRHKKYNVRGVQFHPESILTEYGLQLIKNWITN